MKQLKYILFALAAVTSLAVLYMPSKASAANLLPNSSVESSTNSTDPDDWYPAGWGTNTRNLTYASSGHTGSKSLRIDVTAYTDGDAKWVSDPVDIFPDTGYRYSSYYKSSVATSVVLQYTDDNDDISYVTAQSVAASMDWSSLNVAFTTPADAKKVIVMHIIDSVGWLQTDNFSLEEVVPVQANGPNLIANSSLENLDSSMPADWLSSGWGTNTRTFTHGLVGHSGTRSVTTAITAYTDGDAKWYPEEVAATPNMSYLYTDYYKSNVTTRVVVAFSDASSNYTYLELPTAAARSNWGQYSATFTAPSTAAHVTVYHLIDSVGSLTIDDVSLVETGEGGYIANPSMEITNNGDVVSWEEGGWGTNTAQFTHDSDAHSGDYSLKTAITAHTSGDRKWVFDSVDVDDETTYQYEDYYKSNVTSKVIVAFIDAAENYTFDELPAATASTEWTRYSGQFYTPTGTEKVTVYHLIEQVGTLNIDDAKLSLAPTTQPVTNVSGTLSSNVTWTSGNTYVIDGPVTVPNGVTLTISQGSVVKFSQAWNSNITVATGGALVANGTASKPVEFTSIKDDTVGGDTNSNGVSSGAINDYSVALYSTGGGTFDLEHVRIQFAETAVQGLCTSTMTTGQLSIVDSHIGGTLNFSNCGSGVLSLQRNLLAARGTPTAISMTGTTYPNNVALAGVNTNKATSPSEGNVVSADIVEASITWSIDGASKVALLGNSLEVVGTLELGPGAVVKSGVLYGQIGVTVHASGALHVTGTNTNPVIFTSTRDNTVMGDSDLADSIAAGDNDYESGIFTYNGEVEIEYASFAHGRQAATINCYNSTTPAPVTISRSVIRGAVLINDCNSEDPSIIMTNNELVPTGLYAIRTNDSEISGIALQGSTSNIATTSLPAVFYVDGSQVRVGNEWGVEASSNVQLLAHGLIIGGEVNLGEGVIIKSDVATGIHSIFVDGGAHLVVEGTSEDPVIMTSYKDDSVGGDSNGDATATTPAASDYGTAVYANTGAYIDITGMHVKYAQLGFDLYNIAEPTFEDVAVTHVYQAFRLVSSNAYMDDIIVANVQDGVVVTGNTMASYRGSFTNVTGEAISVCESSCAVDATYTEWGSTDPLNNPSQTIVCGKVMVNPRKVSGVTAQGSPFIVPDCTTGVSPEEELTTSGHAFQIMLDDLEVLCAIDQDACDDATRRLGCFSAAIDVLPDIGVAIFPIPSPYSPDDYVAMALDLLAVYVNDKAVDQAVDAYSTAEAYYEAYQIAKGINSAFNSCLNV